MGRSSATPVLTAMFIAASAGVAHADESDGWFENKPRPKLAIDLEIAGKVGYGSDDFNFGLGGRAGISVLGIYGGASIVNYFGGNVVNDGVSVSVSFLTYGGELGYGFRIGWLTIRPLLGLGLAGESFPATESPGTTFSTFYVQPGGLVEVTLGHLIFGVDAAALIPTTIPFADIGPTFTTHGQIGVRFDVPAPPGTTDD